MFATMESPRSFFTTSRSADYFPSAASSAPHQHAHNTQQQHYSFPRSAHHQHATDPSDYSDQQFEYSYSPHNATVWTPSTTPATSSNSIADDAAAVHLAGGGLHDRSSSSASSSPSLHPLNTHLVTGTSSGNSVGYADSTPSPPPSATVPTSVSLSGPAPIALLSSPTTAMHPSSQHPSLQPPPPNSSSSPQDAPARQYSFIPLQGNSIKKRPRRRYDEIERLYPCNWQGCNKSYGTLNHLNAHVSMQRHGEKRNPNEFKEMRKVWRKQKKDEQAQAAAIAMAQGIGALPHSMHAMHHPHPHHAGGLTPPRGSRIVVGDLTSPLSMSFHSPDCSPIDSDHLASPIAHYNVHQHLPPNMHRRMSLPNLSIDSLPATQYAPPPPPPHHHHQHHEHQPQMALPSLSYGSADYWSPPTAHQQQQQLAEHSPALGDMDGRIMGMPQSAPPHQVSFMPDPLQPPSQQGLDHQDPAMLSSGSHHDDLV